MYLQFNDFSFRVSLEFYRSKIQWIKIATGRIMDDDTINEEKGELMRVNRQVGWAACQGRQDLAYGVSACQQERPVSKASDGGSLGGMPREGSQIGAVVILASPVILDGKADMMLLEAFSQRTKRQVRRPMGVEVGATTVAFEHGDVSRAASSATTRTSRSEIGGVASARWRRIGAIGTKASIRRSPGRPESLRTGERRLTSMRWERTSLTVRTRESDVSQEVSKPVPLLGPY